MNTVRRSLLRLTSGFIAIAAAGAAGMLRPMLARAAPWNKAGFESKALADALKSLGAAGAAESRDIVITAPDIAENGAVVPIEISSAIAGTTSIAVIIEKNPFPLAAQFDFDNGALPYVKLNVKMNETSDIRAVATAGGRRYAATKEIKVTIGGCGG